MFCVGKQLSLSESIAAHFVGHDHTRLILQTIQQPLEKTLGGVGIAPRLNQDVERNAILIDGSPEVVLNTPDPNEFFIQKPS